MPLTIEQVQAPDRARGEDPAGDAAVAAEDPAPQVVADAPAAHTAAFPPGIDGSLFTAQTGATTRPESSRPR